MRIKLVCNADSGGGTDLDALRAALPPEGDPPDRVVVAGGDGTVGAGAALAAELGLPLAVVPTGTANDFARALGLPLDTDAAVALAATGTATRTVELGRAGDTPFVNAASTGLAVDAARRAAPLKPLLGPLAYPAGALVAGLRGTPVDVRVEGVYTGRAWQVIVACTGAFGGGADIDVADPGDGRLDLLVLPARGRAALLRYARALRRGDIADAPGVVHARAESVRMRVPPGTRFNVDGEIMRLGGDVELRIAGGVDVIVH